MRSGQVSPLVEHLFRKRAGQMVAHLTRLFGPAHVDLAEEVVQDALVKALQQWPFHGVPANPGGWLLSVARNAALDTLRRHGAFRQREDAIVAELERTRQAMAPDDASIDRLFEDDELQMMALCCDPALSRDASVALALKTVGGFSVAEIARAFLAEPSTIAQRLVRAKRQLRQLGIQQSTIQIERVLEVLYLMFNGVSRRPAASRSCGRTSARRRSGSRGWSPSIPRPPRRKPTRWPLSSPFRRHASPRV